MTNPFHALGFRLLKTTLDGESAQAENPLRLSRRGFLLCAASLSSCSAAPSLTSQTAGLLKTPYNSNYRTPSFQGPIPRNPDMAFSSNFSNSAGITFTRVMVSGKYVAMTFDDGPHPQNTPRLLDILRVRNIKATFYLIGQSVDLYPQVVRRTVAEGHEIGNHTQSHRLLSKLSDSEIRMELSRCRDAIARASGVQPRTMRPPFGGLLQRQREMIHNEFGYPTILWSVDPFDWKRPGSSVVTSRILHGTTAGSIILSHDLHASTVDAMPATLDGLLRNGFQFVTVSQLLAMKTDAATVQAAVTTDHS